MLTETLTLKLAVPRALLEKLESNEAEALAEIKRQIVLYLVKQGEISRGRGAEILRVSYRDFLDLMAKRGVPYFDYEPGEVKKDLENIKSALGQESIEV